MANFNGFNGNTSIGAVAGAWHQRAEGMMAELGAPVDVRLEGSNWLDVPGTDLELHWSTDTTARDGTTLSEARVKARVDGRSVNLLAFATVMPDFGTPIRRIEGFRRGEPSGDYSLGTLRVGLVECKLGSLGLDGRSVEEPFGTTKERLTRLLTNLDRLDLARLELVDRGIREGFEAVEMIQGGEPAADVLEMLDRTPQGFLV